MSPTQPISELQSGESQELTVAISAAMVELHAEFYAHDRTTATTYINDKIVVWVDPSPRGRLPECQPDHSRGGLRAVLPRCRAPRRAPSDDPWSR